MNNNNNTENPHFKGFRVKFLPATNYRPNRIKIIDTRVGNSITISYDDNYNSSKDMAIDFLNENGLETTGSVWVESGRFSEYIILTEDFAWDINTCIPQD